jgi:hypothetical protein
MMRRSRLTKLERAAAARNGSDLTRHWERVNDQRLADLEHFLAAIPDSFESRVMELLPRIGERLFVAGMAWATDEDPAFVRWALMRAAWGRDHTFNQPLPDPIPAALLNLYLDNPGADICYCPHCRAALPFVPASGLIGVPYRAGMSYVHPRSIAPACPICGVDILLPRLC